MLLELYNFYIIPMVNVDSVVLGNSHTNLSGINLSYSWQNYENNNNNINN